MPFVKRRCFSYETFPDQDDTSYGLYTPYPKLESELQLANQKIAILAIDGTQKDN